MNTKTTIVYILAVLRAVVCFLLVALTSSISHSCVYDRLFSGMIDDGAMPPILVLLYSAAVYLICLFLFIKLFACYHAPLRQSLSLCKRGTTVSFKEKVLLLFQNPFFLISFLTTAALILLASDTVGQYLAQIIFGASYTYGNLMLITAVALPFLLALIVFAYLSAARNIRNEGIQEKLKHNETPIRSFIWAVFNLFLAVVCGSVLIPLLVVMASQFLIFLVFFPTIVTVLLAFWALRYIRAVRIRRKFLRQLKDTCQKNHYTLSKIQKPYRSLFFITEGMSFSVTDSGGKQYDCKLLHSIKRTAPMFFHNDGFATLVSPINFFKAELGYRVKTMPYSFESEHPKCVIVCPIPRAFYARNESSDSDVDSAVTESKFIFAGIGGARMGMGGLHEMDLPKNARSRVMDIGDSFNGYKFFNATAFLNAIEFNVFDK